MRRSLLAVALLASSLLTTCATSRHTELRGRVFSHPCTPELSCWPSEEDWQRLRSSLTGKLERPPPILQPCRVDAGSDACAAAMAALKNPFQIQDLPQGTQSLGWLGAWEAAPSAYVVTAETAQDIVAAVNFAHQHKLRLVVKGTGHDYLGRSNAPDSLLIWTHKMRRVTTNDAFVPQGCSNAAPLPAVAVEAGTRWLEAYQEVTGRHGRYVQGGGCTSVGAAGGFIQGGGFGSWSKKYGIAAAGMLEAEVVTADGRLLVANACQNQDLFWALRGGGGGTFGIVTRLTLKTHPLPSHVGFILGRINAKTDAAFRELLERFLSFYRQALHNENWGEQVSVRRDNSLRLSMSFQGMTAKQAEETWRPFFAWIEQQPERFAANAHYLEVPANKMWDYDYLQKLVPSALVRDPRSEGAATQFWWAGNQEEVATYWYAYQSRWIPVEHFEPSASKAFAAVLFEASRHWHLEFHFGKGQAGASAEALQRDKETSMNPAVYKAAALMIAAAASAPSSDAKGTGYPGVKERERDLAEGEAEKARVTAAMKLVRDATPGAGAYVNEADYFEPDWQRAFWGENYEKLLEIKRRFDPEGMFSCHHCVGSEDLPTGSGVAQQKM